MIDTEIEFGERKVRVKTQSDDKTIIGQAVTEALAAMDDVNAGETAHRLASAVLELVVLADHRSYRTIQGHPTIMRTVIRDPVTRELTGSIEEPVIVR